MEKEGKLEEFGIIKENVGKNNATLYRYRIGGQSFSCFKALDEWTDKIALGDYVINTYEEAPNKDPKKPPYKNIKNIVPGVAPEEVEDSNKQYNVEPVGNATGPNWDEINEVKDMKILFGMVFKKSIDWIINERKLKATNTAEGTTSGYSLDENFDIVFNHLWDKALAKRKEKLE